MGKIPGRILGKYLWLEEFPKKIFGGISAGNPQRNFWPKSPDDYAEKWTEFLEKMPKEIP